MATNTTNYGFKKPDESDFYDVADQNKNWDLADEALKNLDTPTFEDYTGSTAVPSATDAIDQIKSKGKLGTLLSNIKAAFKGACLIGHIVNNCVTDNAGLPLSAAQGKVLKDLYTQLYSDLNTTNNNLSNKADKTSLSSYALKSDLPQSGRTPAIDCESNAVTEFKVTFPKAFSKAPAVIVTPYSGTSAVNGIPKYSVITITTTGFTIRIYNNDSEQRSPAFYWIAMAQS